MVDISNEEVNMDKYPLLKDAYVTFDEITSKDKDGKKWFEGCKFGLSNGDFKYLYLNRPVRTPTYSLIKTMNKFWSNDTFKTLVNNYDRDQHRHINKELIINNGKYVDLVDHVGIFKPSIPELRSDLSAPGIYRDIYNHFFEKQYLVNYISVPQTKWYALHGIVSWDGIVTRDHNGEEEEYYYDGDSLIKEEKTYQYGTLVEYNFYGDINQQGKLDLFCNVKYTDGRVSNVTMFYGNTKQFAVIDHDCVYIHYFIKRGNEYELFQYTQFRYRDMIIIEPLNPQNFVKDLSNKYAFEESVIYELDPKEAKVYDLSETGISMIINEKEIKIDHYLEYHPTMKGNEVIPRDLYYYQLDYLNFIKFIFGKDVMRIILKYMDNNIVSKLEDVRKMLSSYNKFENVREELKILDTLI
ncbi:MAG: hypothetical protein Solumvirus5_16 [Solumvirus sp.]|uniref:Uncharacterized protein n=1 Tax=Solumvirus sp. TaxID=2487773 RepID=A0A3G5AKG2_9VIRU|nr:MAG: hypothetical protein Solumvirus5_16 [Solumvirus sp.]